MNILPEQYSHYENDISLYDDEHILYEEYLRADHTDQYMKVVINKEEFDLKYEDLNDVDFTGCSYETPKHLFLELKRPNMDRKVLCTILESKRIKYIIKDKKEQHLNEELDIWWKANEAEIGHRFLKELERCQTTGSSFRISNVLKNPNKPN